METPVMQAPPPPPPGTKTNVLSIVSLVTGIVGFLSNCLGIIPLLGWFCFGLGGVVDIAALISGFIGISKTKATGEKGRGMAIAGIVLAALGLLGICVMVILTIAAPSILNSIGNVFSGIGNGLGSGGY